MIVNPQTVTNATVPFYKLHLVNSALPKEELPIVWINVGELHFTCLILSARWKFNRHCVWLDFTD